MQGNAEADRLHGYRFVVRTILILAAVAACVPPASEPKSSSDKADYIPMPDRTETVTAERPIDGIDISVTTYGAAGWRIAVANNTDTALSLNWDESTFVSAKGESLGRLVPGNTKKMDIEKPHAPTPLAAHARTVEVVFVEKIIGAENVEQTYAEAVEKLGSSTVKLNRSVEKMRRMSSAAVHGGRIDLVVNVGGSPQTWSGRVSE